MTVVVVGAGMAGLACARELVDAGVPARVVERHRVVGGRLASEFLGGRWTDTGAAYLTADDPAFLGRLRTWRIDGLARPWTDTFHGQHGPPAMRWAAPGGLGGLAADLARELDVTLGVEVTALPRAEAVVLAMPGPQALRIADLPAAWKQSWSPAVTAVLAYPERVWTDFGGAFVADHPVLATVCDDGDRRGDRAPVLVAHSTAAFAREHADFVREHADFVREHADFAGEQADFAREQADGRLEEEMAKAVAEVLGIAPAPDVTIRYWPYAQPRAGHGLYAVHDGVYLCGDAFGRPRVQTAWLSGRAVARAILRGAGGHSTER